MGSCCCTKGVYRHVSAKHMLGLGLYTSLSPLYVVDNNVKQRYAVDMYELSALF